MKTKYSLLLGSALALGAAATAHADLIVTYAEQPNLENTSLNGTSVFDFNSLTANRRYTDLAWSGVGTIDSIYVKGADNYGGATDATHGSGSNYGVQSTSVGTPNNVIASTLNLNAPISYFGLWWSAGDAKNVLDFYNSGSLVAEFTTGNLMAALPSTYDGNPRNRSLDSGEPFGFINFYGQSGVSWDKIVFRNNGSSGFEADNYTVRAEAWGTLEGETGAAPGKVVETINGLVSTPAAVPDGGIDLAMALFSFGGVICLARHTKKS